jgi:hypothetical protein
MLWCYSPTHTHVPEFLHSVHKLQREYMMSLHRRQYCSCLRCCCVVRVADQIDFFMLKNDNIWFVYLFISWLQHWLVPRIGWPFGPIVTSDLFYQHSLSSWNSFWILNTRNFNEWFHLESKLVHPNFVYFVGVEVFTVVTVENAVFWNVGPCKSCMNQRFGGTYHDTFLRNMSSHKIYMVPHRRRRHS